jgi:hypothetical protein
MLDEIRLGIDDARQQQELVRQVGLLERGIFVLMARVGELDRERANLGPGQHRQDVGQRHVVDVRPVVVAPAAMERMRFARNASQGLVQRGDVHLGDLDELGDALVLKERGAFQRQVGRIDLQDEVARRSARIPCASGAPARRHRLRGCRSGRSASSWR